jgi:hypothetical protein
MKKKFAVMPMAVACHQEVATRLSTRSSEVTFELVSWSFSNMHERVSISGRVIVVVVKQDIDTQ